MGSTGIYTDESFQEVFNRHVKVTGGERFNCIADGFKGNINYSVWLKDGQKAFALVTKFSRYKGEVIFKEMDEGCGPCYYDMPKKLYKLLTSYPSAYSESEWATEWRKKVESNMETAKVSIKAGDIVKFNGISFGETWDKLHYKVIDLQSKLLLPIDPTDGTEYHKSFRFRGVCSKYLTKV